MKRIILPFILIVSIMPVYGLDLNLLLNKFTGIDTSTENIGSLYSSFVFPVLLNLDKDLTYQFAYDTMGGRLKCEGTYTVDKDVIHFSQTKFDSEDGLPNIFGKKGELRIIDTPESLYFSKVLEYRSLDPNPYGTTEPFRPIFGIESTAVKEGVKRSHGGIPVIIVNKYGRVTTGAKIRKGPSTNSEAVEYSTDPYSQQFGFVPRNTRIKVIARTENKVAVDKWNNYWYLVTVGMQKEVWMYGEFIRME